MGRICAVKNCDSGRNADIVRRKKLGVRQVTLFTIPKRNNALQTWSIAIGQNLAEKDAICELHFSNESILKEDKTVLHDGTVHVIPRQKYGLVANAVPMAIADEENIEPGPVVRNVEKEGALVPDAPVVRYETKPVPEAPIAKTEVEPIDLQKNVHGFADHFLESCSELSNDAQGNLYPCESVNYQDHRFGFAGRLMGTSVESSTPCSESDANTETANEQQNVCEPMLFVIDDVFEYLKETPLPETWCWVTNRKEENSIVLIKIDPYTYKPTLRLVLYNDLSVTVYTADKKASIELDSKVATVQLLEKLLDDMGGKVVCGGSGMEEESRDQYCPAFVGPDEYGKFVETPRCNNCRKLRRKIQNRKNRRQTDLKTTLYARSKHAAQVKLRAYKRLRDKAIKEFLKYLDASKVTLISTVKLLQFVYNYYDSR